MMLRMRWVHPWAQKVLSIKHAIFLAAIFEVLGALLASDAVTSTISRGLVDFEDVPNAEMMIVIGMIASLGAAASWLLVATWFGWPVSTTHCIIGAILGFGCLLLVYIKCTGIF